MPSGSEPLRWRSFRNSTAEPASGSSGNQEIRWRQSIIALQLSTEGSSGIHIAMGCSAYIRSTGFEFSSAIFSIKFASPGTPPGCDRRRFRISFTRSSHSPASSVSGLGFTRYASNQSFLNVWQVIILSKCLASNHEERKGSMRKWTITENVYFPVYGIAG